MVHLLTLLQLATIKPAMRDSILERYRSVGALYTVLAQDSSDTFLQARDAAIDDMSKWSVSSKLGSSKKRWEKFTSCKFKDSFSGTAGTVTLNETNCGFEWTLSSGDCNTDWRYCNT